LQRKFGSKREELLGSWRSLHNEELRKVYASLDVITVIKSRRMRLMSHVAHVGDIKNAYKLLAGKP